MAALMRRSAASGLRCGGAGALGLPARRASDKAVSMDSLNPGMIRLQFAIRGPVVDRAYEIAEELRKGKKKPFTKVIAANLGDAHAMGQKPITFIRQVLACVAHPGLMESGDMPHDVKSRARIILRSCVGGSVGSYTMSYGIDLIRKDVAQYIERRDGHPADWRNVVLTNGASTAIQKTMEMFRQPSGVMIPIPQYPLYSATLAEYELKGVGYYLDEDKNWGLDIKELERAYNEASKDIPVRAFVVINPGNPTGQVLTRADIENLIKFTYHRRMMLLADEVYQHNVYSPNSLFFSFKKVLTEMGKPYNKQQELVSFMSISKGYMGECGLRGGWMELVNIDPEVQAQLYKCISAMLCPTTLGQTAIDCVARPPRPGEPSHELWLSEKNAILGSLKERSRMITETFNKMKGFKCNEVQGAMYAFPRLELSPGALEAARAHKMAPDTFYTLRLLEETGICVVPGTGFKQLPGTHHFRTTILPQPALLREMLDSFQKFHEKFTKEFS